MNAHGGPGFIESVKPDVVRPVQGEVQEGAVVEVEDRSVRNQAAPIAARTAKTAARLTLKN